MTSKHLAHLVGDYQSDSDNDDSGHKQKVMNNVSTDWSQCTDAGSGHPYYWNIVTKEVTWEIPLEYERFLEQVARQNPFSQKKWILCDTDDNAPYYFNEITREISWEKPSDFIEPNNSSLLNNNNNSRQSKSMEISNRVTTKTKLNLVPEYNSDESDDDSTKPVENPIFPSSNISYPTKSSIKCIEIPSESSTEITPSESKQPNSPKKVELMHKEKPSFASIITGGRSPQHESVDIKLYTGEEPEEDTSRMENNANETELVPQKTFQRKRRIEFNVSSTHTKRVNQNDDIVNELAKDTGSTVASLKSQYNNFQKGETEFVEKASSKESEETDTDAETKPNANNHIEIRDEQQLLEAKINFLCQGRTDVSPVQVIQIQLQTLQAAHMAEALHSDYLLEWMRNISNDLIKLESDAAPDGWKCLWNRGKAQYCYENTTTGEIKWEYPENESTENAAENNTVIDDDAMDICTTPPPNEHENLSAVYYKSTEYHAADCAPSKWATGEAIKNDPEKPLDDELASFYSDIAKLEPDTTNDENSCDKSSSNPDPSASPENSVSETDDKKKKKKKKTKKLEPWRSGNLETWINKWQKAKKELDG